MSSERDGATSSSTDDSEGSSRGFFTRTLLMPVSRAVWSESVTVPVGWILLSLSLLAMALYGLFGPIKASALMTQLRAGVEHWEKNYPTVIIENGQVSVDGGGIIRDSDALTTFLVDPEETVDLGEIPTPEYLIVRKSVIIVKRAGQEMQIFPIEELATLFGPGAVAVDGPSMRRFLDESGASIQASVVVLLMLVGWIFDVASCVLSALPAAAFASSLEGMKRGLGFSACFRIALASSALPLVVLIGLSFFAGADVLLVARLVGFVLVGGLTFVTVTGFPEVADDDSTTP